MDYPTTMPLAEAEAVSALSPKHLRARSKDSGAEGRLDEIAQRVLVEALIPILRGEIKVRDAAERIHPLRLEANWLLLKERGFAALFTHSMRDLSAISRRLRKSCWRRASWTSGFLELLEQLKEEHNRAIAIASILDSADIRLNEVPLEWIERWLPSQVVAADVTSLALSCVTAILDQDIQDFYARKLSGLIRAARQVGPDYAKLIRTWSIVVQEILASPDLLKGFQVSRDPTTLTVLLAVTAVHESLRWLGKVVEIARKRLLVDGDLWLQAVQDPEDSSRVTLRLHVHPAQPLSEQHRREAGFWEAVEEVGSDVVELITLSYRPIADAAARVS